MHAHIGLVHLEEEVIKQNFAKTTKSQRNLVMA
jgi:hypothetical protein